MSYRATEWRAEAACRDEPTDTFFPAQGDYWTLQRARSICADCPVKVQCLAESRVDPHTDGVWGGLSGHQRRELRSTGVPPVPRRVAGCGTEAGARRHRRNDEAVCRACREAENLAGSLRRERRRALEAES